MYEGIDLGAAIKGAMPSRSVAKRQACVYKL